LTAQARRAIMGDMSATEIKLPWCTCERCGGGWGPRVVSPRRCPFCKSPYWRKPVTKKGGVK
jgi:hypothetical protein